MSNIFTFFMYPSSPSRKHTEDVCAGTKTTAGFNLFNYFLLLSFSLHQVPFHKQRNLVKLYFFNCILFKMVLPGQFLIRLLQLLLSVMGCTPKIA